MVEGFHRWGRFWLVRGMPAGSPVRSWVETVERWTQCLNPLYVLEPVWERVDVYEMAGRILLAWVLYGGIGIVFLIVAIARLRSVYMRQLQSARRPRRLARVVPRRPVDDEPLRWKEREVEGLGLWSLLRWAPRWVGAVAVFADSASVHSPYLFGEPSLVLFALAGGIVLAASNLIAAFRAADTICGERERQTWESILLAPLETWELVGEKMQGILDSIFPYVFAYALPALLFAFLAGWEEFAVVVSLLMMTSAGTYFMTANGIWCSARSRSSWRSLLSTFAVGYGYVFGLLMIFSLMGIWLSCAMLPVRLMLGWAGIANADSIITMFFGTLCSGIYSWVLWRAGQGRIFYAEKWVDANDRSGRTFARSLERALRKHAEKLEPPVQPQSGAPEPAPS